MFFRAYSTRTARRRVNNSHGFFRRVNTYLLLIWRNAQSSLNYIVHDLRRVRSRARSRVQSTVSLRSGVASVWARLDDSKSYVFLKSSNMPADEYWWRVPLQSSLYPLPPSVVAPINSGPLWVPLCPFGYSIALWLLLSTAPLLLWLYPFPSSVTFVVAGRPSDPLIAPLPPLLPLHLFGYPSCCLSFPLRTLWLPLRPFNCSFNCPIPLPLLLWPIRPFFHLSDCLFAPLSIPLVDPLPNDRG